METLLVDVMSDCRCAKEDSGQCSAELYGELYTNCAEMCSFLNHVLLAVAAVSSHMTCFCFFPPWFGSFIWSALYYSFIPWHG